MAKLYKINRDNLRDHNLSVVIQTLLNSTDPMSRADLAKSTGLTKAAMSMLVEILIKNKVIQQLSPIPDSTFGRPSVPLAFYPHHWVGIGLQVNTDGYGFTVLDLAGETIYSQWVDDTMLNVVPEDIFTQLDHMLQPVENELIALGYTICGASIAVPGLVENKTTLVNARNLKWKNINLQDFNVIRRLHAVAANEADLAAIAQLPGYASADQSIRPIPNSFIYLSTDIGISGAVVSNGTVVHGEHNFAGEIGHLSVDWNGPQCSCGRCGCLEQYAGRRALVEAAHIADGDAAVTRQSVKRLLEAWKQHDTDAEKAISRGMKAMASGLCSAINLLDISNVILGGFWVNFTDAVAKQLEKDIQGIALGRDASLKVNVDLAPFADHPALRGAALVGLRRLVDHPMHFLSDSTSSFIR
ncbi:MAG: ROK family transcriptional regulator [Aeriscardovia sp.]|nr:ROK family transcriptional regulator [Aeriscardovia sp.]